MATGKLHTEKSGAVAVKGVMSELVLEKSGVQCGLIEKPNRVRVDGKSESAPGDLLIPPGDRSNWRGPASRGAWRQGVLRQAVHGWWLTSDDMSREVHIQLLSRGDTSESRTTSGEVHRAGLRAGRFVEAGPRASRFV
ncbi:hypothetical protein DEO72_LG1g2085 [Vigna unguiculata]|uniref:Uncharacterized protein n=1 Tax=Vigna unguiculata TaxID=3917 RepID=A0A4D6KLS4_VIGUN|nr:hypothetical protein DEO72_LG1g2085 [Vigna unguiculata]